MPFVFVVIAIDLAENGHPLLAFISSFDPNPINRADYLTELCRVSVQIKSAQAAATGIIRTTHIFSN